MKLNLILLLMLTIKPAPQMYNSYYESAKHLWDYEGSCYLEENGIEMGNALYQHSEEKAELAVLRVGKSFRRKGHGTRLFQEVAGSLRQKGLKQMSITAIPFKETELDEIVEFYRAMGAEVQKNDGNIAELVYRLAP